MHIGEEYACVLLYDGCDQFVDWFDSGHQLQHVVLDIGRSCDLVRLVDASERRDGVLPPTIVN